MADSHRSTVIVAFIGLIGTLGAAVIANWDKIAGGPVEPKVFVQPKSEPMDEPEPPLRKGASKRTVSIAGLWRDPSLPANSSEITQDGDEFEVTGAGFSPMGVGFRTAGEGQLNGLTVSLNYVTTYQTGLQTRGACTGTVTSGGGRMTLACSDPASGTYVLTAIKD